MDAYKPPESNLLEGKERPNKLIAGILIGLFYTVIVTTIVSAIWLIAFGVFAGLDLTAPSIQTEMSQRPAYMVIDVIFNILVLYLGGRSVGRRTPGRELKFGIILAAITFIIYLAFFVMTDAFEALPLAYNIIALISVVVAIPYGANRAAKS